MINRSHAHNIPFLLALQACLLIPLLSSLGDSNSLIIHEILNFGHILLFGTASLAFLWLLNGRSWPVHTTKYYYITFFAAVCFGIVTEFLQALTPDRDFEISDMIRDAIGALSFLAVAYPSRLEYRSTVRKLRAVSLGAVALAGMPIVFALILTWQMERDFPLISSLEAPWETVRWQAKEASLTRSRAYATHGAYALEAHFKPGIYPGVVLEHFYGDWTGYESFSFDVFLEGSTPLAITVRIDDASHDQSYQDRYNKTFDLAPGSNHVSMDLQEVRSSPRGRFMDMRNITGMMVFSYNLKEPRTLFFDNFRLGR